MANNKVIFRADGNSEIGLGHVIRSLSLANMLNEDFNCEFAIRSTTDFVKHEIEKVCSNINFLPDKEDLHFTSFLDLLVGDEIVVLDNYFYSTDYQKQIKNKGCKLVCIDDMCNKHFVADLIINHAPGITSNIYSGELYTKYCLGLDYVLLRRPFLEIAKEKRRKQSHNASASRKIRVFLSFGATDNNNLTKKYLELLISQIIDVDVEILVSSSYQHARDLLSFIQNNELSLQCNLYTDIRENDLIKILNSVDFAITSSSTISLEVIATGTQLFTGFYVDNQKEIYKGLIDTGKVYPLGNLIFEGESNLKHYFNKGKGKLRFDKEYLLIDGNSDIRLNNAFKQL